MTERIGERGDLREACQESLRFFFVAVEGKLQVPVGAEAGEETNMFLVKPAVA